MKSKLNDKPWWKVALTNIAAMALAAAVLLLILFKWMDKYTMHGQYITVPDLSGMTEEMASDNLSGMKLRYEISEYRYDAGKEEGQIIEQRPAAGQNVKAGRIIYLTINSGKIPTRPLPDVADNSSLRAAESRLMGAGFNLTEPELIPGDLDWVYDIKLGDEILRAGQEIPEGSTLTIVAGNGEERFEELGDSLANMGIDMDFFNE